ncbi:MAG TPA: AIM24 family protein [Stellaceae bacterium]|nr:AIM24 family protein [Stellaceae bacterium]
MSFLSQPPQLLPTRAQDAQAGGVTYHIAGELVPALAIDLQPGQSVYFEHHILLWKDPNLQFGVRPLGGMVKRMIAGMELLIVEAVGPGQVAFSRDGVGHVFPVVLRPGEELHVREHQFLAATGNIDFTWERVQGISNMLLGGTGFFIDKFRAVDGYGVVWLHGHGNVFEKTLLDGEQFDVEPGGWLYKDPSVAMETNFQGLAAGFLGGMRLTCNRFTGPGRLALQSMSAGVESSAAEHASQSDAQSASNTALGVIGAIAGGIFGSRE